MEVFQGICTFLSDQNWSLGAFTMNIYLLQVTCVKCRMLKYFHVVLIYFRVVF